MSNSAPRKSSTQSAKDASKAVLGKAAGCCGGAWDALKEFLTNGSVMELAVAIVVGNAFTDLVDAFIAAFVTPLIGLFGPISDSGELAFYINGVEFPYGMFITALISFILIIVSVFYGLIWPLLSLQRRLYPIRDCPECLADDVPAMATRCMHCCIPLEPLPRRKSSMFTLGSKNMDDEDEIVVPPLSPDEMAAMDEGAPMPGTVTPPEFYYDAEADGGALNPAVVRLP